MSGHSHLSLFLPIHGNHGIPYLTHNHSSFYHPSLAALCALSISHPLHVMHYASILLHLRNIIYFPDLRYFFPFSLKTQDFCKS